MGELKLGRCRLETPAVCGSVIGGDIEAMEAGMARAIEQGADMVELRIDGLRDPAGWEKILRAKIPIILTNRPEREGGKFKGDEGGRVKPLLDGIAEGVACIDIELSTPEHLREQVISRAKGVGVSVLISYHDFSATPPIDSLVDVARRLVEAGCDIAKIVTFAKEPRDSLRTLDFLVEVQNEVSVPVIAFAMGEAGSLSRIAAPLLGSPIAFAAADDITAPGQFDIPTTKLLLDELIKKEKGS